MSTTLLKSESREFEVIKNRLQLSFPELDPDELQVIVDDAKHEFEGAPVRQFVPLLVERQAKRTCLNRRDQG